MATVHVTRRLGRKVGATGSRPRRSRMARIGSVTVGVFIVLACCAAGGSSSRSGVYSGLKGDNLVFAIPGAGQSFISGLQTSFFKPFEKRTGATVTVENASSLPSTLAAQEQAHHVTMDMMVYATAGDALLAHKQGLLQKFDSSVVPLRELNAKTADSYSIDAWPYATVVAWNTHDFSGKAAPSNITDIFNETRYPGKRCLYDYPEYGAVLESALIDSGVSKSSLYPLDTSRAFAQLDKLKGNVVWWTTGATAEEDLANGTCSMALYYSGDIYTMAKLDHESVALAWGNAVVDTTVITVPKGAPSPRAANALIHFILGDKSGQETLMTKIAYPTVTYKEAKNGPKTPSSLARWVPAGTNLKTEITPNDNYYENNIDKLTNEFNAWVLTQ